MSARKSTGIPGGFFVKGKRYSTKDRLKTACDEHQRIPPLRIDKWCLKDAEWLVLFDAVYHAASRSELLRMLKIGPKRLAQLLRKHGITVPPWLEEPKEAQ